MNGANDGLNSRLPVVLVVFGTRPEAIKLAPVLAELARSGRVRPLAVVTGQHDKLLKQATRILGVAPEFDLALFRESRSLNEFSAELVPAIDRVFSQTSPSAVLVQGDTSTALITGLAAFNRRIPVIHLEAGLRSHDLDSPFPEEGNRRILSQIAALNLCPSSKALENLMQEGISQSKCEVVGNTVIDALKTALKTDSTIENQYITNLVSSNHRIILVTAHRRENWGKPLVQIASALRNIARRFPSYTIVLPVHGNPMLRLELEPILDNLPNVELCESLDYIQFCKLLNASHFVLTDSGGLQEEAPALGKPVLVLRDTTERVEALDAGTIRLIGTEITEIESAVAELIESPEIYAKMANRINPYGDGGAAIECRHAIEALLFDA